MSHIKINYKNVFGTTYKRSATSQHVGQGECSDIYVDLRTDVTFLIRTPQLISRRNRIGLLKPYRSNLPYR